MIAYCGQTRSPALVAELGALGIGDAWALESTVALARQLVAERDQLRAARPATDADPGWRDGWNAALLDELAAELHAVTSDRDAIAAHAAELEHAERAQAARSLKRRAAIVRIARHYRAQSVVVKTAIGAGVELGGQCVQRDEAIDALTARVAELMQQVSALTERARVTEPTSNSDPQAITGRSS